MTTELGSISSETQELIEQARNLLRSNDASSRAEIENLKSCLLIKTKECRVQEEKIQILEKTNQALREKLEQLARQCQEQAEVLKNLQQRVIALNKRHLEMTGEDFFEDNRNEGDLDGDDSPTEEEGEISREKLIVLARHMLKKFDAEGILFDKDALQLFIEFWETLMHQDEEAGMESFELLLKCAVANHITRLDLDMVRKFIDMQVETGK